jgi:hypothetical protein
MYSGVDMAATAHNVAVFAADLAIRCHFVAAILPLLPPITPNVTLAWVANRLNSAFERRPPVMHNQKTAKTAMFTSAVNIAARSEARQLSPRYPNAPCPAIT